MAGVLGEQVGEGRDASGLVGGLVGGLAPFRLERWFARFEHRVRYQLSSSDCEPLTIAEVLAFEPGATEAFLQLGLCYLEARGEASFRRVVAGLYTGIAADEIVAFSGAGEAISLYMRAVLAPGDHVIAMTPCYQSLVSMPVGLGASVSAWPMDPEAGWAPDIEALDRLVRPETRLLVLNAPHNPTGFTFSRAAFLKVLGWAEAHGLRVLSDEVYRGLERDPGERLPAACEVYAGATSIGVMSKAYALAGLRVGWLASRDREALEAAFGLKDYGSIANAAPSEFLATIGLQHRDAITARNRALIAENTRTFEAFLASAGGAHRWVAPRAGPIAIATLGGVGDIEAFCAALAEEDATLLLPGTVFELSGPQVRIGLGRRGFDLGLERLAARLASVQK